MNSEQPIENILEKRLADAEGEVAACHACWDSFTEKLCAEMPFLNRRPIFQQADQILQHVEKIRSENEALIHAAVKMEMALDRCLAVSGALAMKAGVRGDIDSALEEFRRAISRLPAERAARLRMI